MRPVLGLLGIVAEIGSTAALTHQAATLGAGLVLIILGAISAIPSVFALVPSRFEDDQDCLLRT
jgi:hypothetical protein